MGGGVKEITGNNLDKTKDYRRYNRTSGTVTRKRLIEWWEKYESEESGRGSRHGK